MTDNASPRTARHGSNGHTIRCTIARYARAFAIGFLYLIPIEAPVAQVPARTVVVIPTLGNDHQFNLDYSVAHLTALLDVIGPGGLIVDDNTSWLGRDCPLSNAAPEVHVALRFARERNIPIVGLRQWPPPGITDAFAASQRSRDAENARNTDTARMFAQWRAVLDRESARIARDYSYPTVAPGLSHLLAAGFAERERLLTTAQRAANETRGNTLAESALAHISASGSPQTWVLLLGWNTARPLSAALEGRGVRVIPVDSFLPLPAAAIERRLDRLHLAWILASNLDEWYGMWAPQAFARERLGELLRRLERAAPGDPVTEYLQARWLMQQRDYSAAEPLLRRLADSASDAVFPFPVNGKWIRPPWSSVRRKAQLNLAFVLDYKGQRAEALALYRGLLALGAELDSEARFFGYLYDDIQSAIASYVERPYTGGPEEAMRHLRGTVGRPRCEPR